MNIESVVITYNPASEKYFVTIMEQYPGNRFYNYWVESFDDAIQGLKEKMNET